MNSKAANHPSGQAISENGRMSRLHRYLPVDENQPTRTAHVLRNRSEWRVNNPGDDSRIEITLRKAGEARPAARDDQGDQVRCFGNGEGRTGYVDYTSAPATGNRREFNEIQRVPRGGLWSTLAPPIKPSCQWPLGKCCGRKPARVQPHAYAKRRGELLSEARPAINAELPTATAQASKPRLVGTSSMEGEPTRKAELLSAATPSVEANSRRQSVPDREAGVRSRRVVRSGQSRIAAPLLPGAAEVLFATGVESRMVRDGRSFDEPRTKAEGRIRLRVHASD
jgi:hypothetical protein